MGFKTCLMYSLFVSLVTVCKGIKCPGPVAEGESATIRCQSDTAKFTWELKLTTGYATVLECASQTCSNAEYTASHSMNGTMYESTLKIKSVNRQKTKYRCFDETCQLEVYVNKVELNCDEPGLEHFGSPRRSALRVNCRVESYPEARCSLQSNPPSDYISRAIPRYGYSTTVGGNNFTSCSFIMLLKGLEAANYDLTVSATPALTSGEAKVPVTSLTKNLILGKPEVTLGDDCPLDDIQPGTYATCSCIMTRTDRLDAYAAWFTPSDQMTGMVVSDVLTQITLVYNPLNPKPNYTCTAVSPVGRHPGIVYSPNFAENVTNLNNSEAHCADPTRL